MELLTIDETAQALKVSPTTVRRFIAAGRLPAVRVGKGIRVRKEAIEELVRPVEPRESRPRPARRRGQPITADDPLWDIVGIARSGGPGDVSSNKYKYLA